MHAQPRRVAWLLNHKALHECEVPLLRSFGYEVFTSKKLSNVEPLGMAYYEDDKSLSIPQEDLLILNKHNYYVGRIAQPILERLNKYFNMVMAAGYPSTIQDLVKGYKGNIVIRVFGRAGNANYSSLFKHSIDDASKIRHRFWMGAAFEEILDTEAEPLKSMSVVLPNGLPRHVTKIQNTWIGGNGKILIICPYIASKRYYRIRYDSLKPILNKMPCVIGGVQPIKPKDPRVTGYLNDREFYGLMQSSEALFYYGIEPRHLHYHPIEGILIGIPLIFLKKSLLGSWMGAQQPGACDTLTEAIDKLNMILSGNKQFIDNILKKQTSILERFSDKAVRRQWANLLDKLNS